MVANGMKKGLYRVIEIATVIPIFRLSPNEMERSEGTYRCGRGNAGDLYHGLVISF